MDIFIGLYKKPNLLAIMMKKIIASRDQYCIDPQGIVRIKSNGKWVPYFDLILCEELYDFELFHAAYNAVRLYNMMFVDQLEFVDPPERYGAELKAHMTYLSLAEDFE